MTSQTLHSRAICCVSTDNGEVPANLEDQYQEAKGSTGTKRWVAAEVMLSPTPKHTWIDQEEDEAAAWIMHKTTEALDWLKYISLKESIIWKAWIGWEEGLRLAHRQQIGEAAARMETTSALPILMLRLTEGEHGQFKAWKRCCLGSPD